MGGLIPENIADFARALRRAGIPVGPAAVIDAVAALEAAGIGTREDFYWILHAIFVKRRDHTAVFTEAFHVFFKNHNLIEKMLEILSPVADGREREREKPKAGAARVSDAFRKVASRRDEDKKPAEIEVDARFTMSDRDILRKKDFAQMTAAEIEIAKRAIATLALPFDRIRTRRLRASHHSVRLDMRRTMRASMRSGGEVLLPLYSAPCEVAPPIVALCDISGSMSQYSRIFLHFLHALTLRNRRVDTFLFGTRLTNISRQLGMKDPDEAFADVSNLVQDWSGGTRIGEAIQTFNRNWSRRVLGQGAVVLMITDGLERHRAVDLDAAMDRLHRSCRRLIWLNPLLRFEGFEAKASGIRTMLRHVDDFRAVHSIEAMADLCAILAEPRGRRHDPKTWLAA